jgi:hypothetical protein
VREQWRPLTPSASFTVPLSALILTKRGQQRRCLVKGRALHVGNWLPVPKEQNKKSPREGKQTAATEPDPCRHSGLIYTFCFYPRRYKEILHVHLSHLCNYPRGSMTDTPCHGNSGRGTRRSKDRSDLRFILATEIQSKRRLSKVRGVIRQRITWALWTVFANARLIYGE